MYTCNCAVNLASFPGLPTVQVLIACGMQNWGMPGPFYHVNDVSVYLSRQRRGGVPHRKNEADELEALSCSYCPRRWSFKRLQSEKCIAPGSK